MAAPFLIIGDVVRLEKLTNVKLNDAVGVVIKDLEFDAAGRYAVQLQSPATSVASHPLSIRVKPMNLTRVRRCSRPGCAEHGRNSCSSCNNEDYCSTDCQKQDWKIHKIMC